MEENEYMGFKRKTAENDKIFKDKDFNVVFFLKK